MVMRVTQCSTGIAIRPRDVELAPFGTAAKSLYYHRSLGTCLKPHLPEHGWNIVDPTAVIRPDDFVSFGYRPGSGIHMDFDEDLPDWEREEVERQIADGQLNCTKLFRGYDCGELYLSHTRGTFKLPLAVMAYCHKVVMVSRWLWLANYAMAYPGLCERYMRRLARKVRKVRKAAPPLARQQPKPIDSLEEPAAEDQQEAVSAGGLWKLGQASTVLPKGAGVRRS